MYGTKTLGLVIVVVLSIGAIMIYTRIPKTVPPTGTIIILNGPSSVGKSSIIRTFQALSLEPWLSIGIDNFFVGVLPPKFYLEDTPEHRKVMHGTPTIDEQGNKVFTLTVGSEGQKVIRGMHRAIAAYALEGNNVIVDYIKYEPAWFDDLTKAVQGLKVIWVGIHASLESIEQREKKRATSPQGHARSHYFTVHQGIKYDLEIDTDALKPEESAQLIFNKVAESAQSTESSTKNKDKIAAKSLLVKTGNIELYTENFGKPSNPAVLLIAGAMAHARFWANDFCTQLADAGYFVIRYDHRDMGLSSAIDYAKNPYTTNNLAKDALAIFDAYGIKQAHIIGHSMGGAIAQLIALDYPSRVLSITLISTAMPVNAHLNNEEKKALENTWLELMKNKPTKKYTESVVGFLNSFEFLHGKILMDEVLTKTYIRDLYERTKPKHLEWFSKFSAGTEPLHNHVKAQQNSADRTHDLKNLKIPVLIIHGQYDCLSLPRIIQAYYDQHVPNAKIIIIDRMGHMILSDELFTSIKNLIVDFISR